MFVDTTWVKIDDLRDFLREREVSVHGMNYLIFFSELMKHLQENARDKHVTDASNLKAIKRTCITQGLTKGECGKNQRTQGHEIQHSKKGKVLEG
jgi:hypothetical protein